MSNLQKAAGVSAIFEALIYVVAFVYFGAFTAYPSDATEALKMAYLADNQFAYSAIYFLMYAVFGAFLAVLVVGLYERLKPYSSSLVQIGSIFGVVWVTLVIASGMLATVGLSHAVNRMAQSPEHAFELWTMISVLVDSFGGGNELVGGLWVLLISIAALKADALPKGLNYLGLIVGISGIATVYPDDTMTEVFGITQIIWFFWLGISLLRTKNIND